MSPEPRPSKGSDPPRGDKAQHLCFADFHSKEKAKFFLALHRRRLSAGRRGGVGPGDKTSRFQISHEPDPR